MQLTDFLQDDFLNSLRKQMNALLIDVSDLPFRGGITYADVMETYEGIEVDIDDIEIRPNGLLYYKGILVSLNIQDVNQSINDEFRLSKLHVSYCQTLEDMKNAGRIKRYVSSSRSDSIRKIRFITNGSYVSRTEERALDVCKHCLSKLKWENYHSQLNAHEKEQIVASFSLEKFYKTYEPQFYQDLIGIIYNENESIPANIYQKNWVGLSYKFRKSKNWRCDSCHKDCSQKRSELHVHHINGDKSDNSRINLSALCYACHAQQPLHEHMLRK